MKNKLIGPAGDQRHHRKRRRNGGRRHNLEMSLGMEAVSILFEKTVLGVLTAEAASRKLALPCMLRGIIHQWLGNLNK